MKSIRLDKLLANLGYGSRREIQMLARQGRIRLGDDALTTAEDRVTPTPDWAAGLTVDGEPLDPLPGMVLMLHKPLGVTCSHKEAGPLVYGLLPARWRRRDPALSTIGRLDKETSGLLLMTDDGALLHRVISPKNHVEKRYRVALARPLRGDEADVLAAGTLLLEGEEKPLLPVAMTERSPTEVDVVLTEGRYHQVRRMFAALGNHVEALHRDRMGGLELPADLEPGALKVLDAADIEALLPSRAA
ncbi:rRNA pseudouridine synthase [Aurantimonas sp. MSK8Z-1]|uniref:pseudouridine synthase n=1 Tax=Mangrovibrevibacter kandeliae TaxID=2968473 RepID=UPI00211848FD|nr:pseudouridine synthase [Aurantimonas sp. MSK8Z-1]MCW4114279.1 rRNA pseudouridine synthase [Aurantimonas sp. MSK8Z-1]